MAEFIETVALVGWISGLGFLLLWALLLVMVASAMERRNRRNG